MALATGVYLAGRIQIAVYICEAVFSGARQIHQTSFYTVTTPLSFVDGTAGKVDMRAFISDSNIDSTIFEPLRIQIVPDRQIVERNKRRD